MYYITCRWHKSTEAHSMVSGTFNALVDAGKLAAHIK